LADSNDDEVLVRLRKLTEQLDVAKKSAETTAKEVTRAKQTVAATERATRLLDTSKHPRRRKTRKKR
jgi:hypothetical protein